MILEYNYDNGNKILNLFKESKLATLDVKTVKDGDEIKFVMEYTLVEDYPEARQELIKEVLAESLSERLQLANVLNKFIENQAIDNVNNFVLKFNTVKVRKCEISYSSSYKQQIKETSSVEELMKCLEKLDHIIVEMGISNQEIPGLFMKDGKGKSKKYVPLTIKDMEFTLRQLLTETK